MSSPPSEADPKIPAPPAASEEDEQKLDQQLQPSDLDLEAAAAVQNNSVVLLSRDGQRFLLDREAALRSATLKAMLTGGGRWAETADARGPPEILLAEIDGEVLRVVCEMLNYRRRYDHSRPPLPKLEVPKQMFVPVLMAVHYLQM